MPVLAVHLNAYAFARSANASATAVEPSLDRSKMLVWKTSQPSNWVFAIDFQPASLVHSAACCWRIAPYGVSTATSNEPPTTRPLPEIAARKPAPPRYVATLVLSQIQKGDSNVP